MASIVDAQNEQDDSVQNEIPCELHNQLRAEEQLLRERLAKSVREREQLQKEYDESEAQSRDYEKLISQLREQLFGNAVDKHLHAESTLDAQKSQTKDEVDTPIVINDITTCSRRYPKAEANKSTTPLASSKNKPHSRKVKSSKSATHRCPHCAQSFSRRDTLQYHMRRHTGERPFRCQKCAYSFTTKSNLLRHQRETRGCRVGTVRSSLPTVKPLESRRDEIPTVDRGTERISGPIGNGFLDSLFVAMSVDYEVIAKTDSTSTFAKSIVGPLPKPDRDAARKIAANRRAHSKAIVAKAIRFGHHRNELKCKICGRGFKRPYELKRHAVTHTGERPFACERCGRAFSQECNLRRHLVEADYCKTMGGV